MESMHRNAARVAISKATSSGIGSLVPAPSARPFAYCLDNFHAGHSSRGVVQHLECLAEAPSLCTSVATWGATVTAFSRDSLRESKLYDIRLSRALRISASSSHHSSVGRRGMQNGLLLCSRKPRTACNLSRLAVSASITTAKPQSIDGFGNDWDDPVEETGMFAAAHGIIEVIRDTLGRSFGERLDRAAVSSPPKIQFFKNEERAAEAGILLCAGKDDGVTLTKEERLRVKSSPQAGGGETVVWMFTLRLGKTTDAPNFQAEFNITSQRVFFVMDMLPRRDLVTNLQYLSEIYETGEIRTLCADKDKDPAFVKASSSDLFSRAALSPTVLFYTLPIPSAEEVPLSDNVKGTGTGFLEGDSRPAVMAVREHLLPLVKRFLEIWGKTYEQRKNNITVADEQNRIQRRDKFLWHYGIKKDLDIPMVASLLGKDLSQFICQNCLHGPYRKLSPEEHWYLGRPFWRFWRGCVTIFDATGQLALLYRMHRDLWPNEDGSLVTHKNLTLLPDGRRPRGPWEFGLHNSREDGIYHPHSDRQCILQLPGGVTCSGGFVVEGESTLCEVLSVCNNGEARFGVLFHYGKDSRLFYVIYDRETAIDPSTESVIPPNKENLGIWTDAVTLEKERVFPPIGMEGIETTLTRELLLSDYWGSWKGVEAEIGAPSGLEDDATWLATENYVLMHLPDGTSVRTPKDLLECRDKRFFVAVYRIMDGGMLQITVRYGVDGHMQSITKAFYASHI